MIKDLLNYYLFEYEIGVYPVYTPLTDQMIRNKMHHYWLLLKESEYKNRVKKIIGAFYDEEGGSGRYIVIDSKATNKTSVTRFRTTAHLNTLINPDEKAVVVPYYLFKNAKVNDVAKKIRRRNNPYEGYVMLKKHIDFIFREEFLLMPGENWEEIILSKSDLYKKKYGHYESYQELWCIIVFNDKQQAIAKSELSELSDSFAMTIKEWGLDLLRGNIIDQKKVILRHGVRSAVAAIMGRNMSHNIGSHILSYWAKLIDEEALRVGDDRNNNWIRYSKLLFDYLRSRMDFIAEISTTNPSWVVSMKFCEDVLYPFLRQSALLNYIAMSEGIHFEDCNGLLCTEKDHHNIIFSVFYEGKQLFGWKYKDGCAKYFGSNDKYKSYNVENKDIQFKNNDPIVAMPHGTTGVHAFYSILENFIRNSAKHGCTHLQNNDPFEITIVLDDSLEDLIKVNISDKIGNCTPRIIKDINKGLGEKLTDQKGIINPGKWGLKEQKISACYLRMGGPDYVDITAKFPPKWSKESKTLKYLTPSCYKCHRDSECAVKESNVRYDFYLQKPKETMILLQAKIKKQQGDMLKTLLNKGVAEIYLTELSQHIKKGIPQRFLVNVNGDSKNKDIDRYAPYLPMRHIQIDAAFYKIAISAKEPVNIFYEEWLKKYCFKTRGWSDNLQIIFRSNAPKGISIKNGFIKYTDQKNFLDLKGNKIIFDDHSEGIKNDQICTNEILYYQGVSAANPTKRLLERMEKTIGDDSKQELKIVELAEAALAKVLIADERIWKVSQKLDSELKAKKNIEGKKCKLLRLMNILLVEVQNKKVAIKDIKNLIKKFDPDFFIIHQGLIDKMSDNDRLQMVKILNSHRSFFVITSGRGLPNGMRDKKYSSARFLEISALEKFIEEYDKLALVQVLYSLRRPFNV